MKIFNKFQEKMQNFKFLWNKLKKFVAQNSLKEQTKISFELFEFVQTTSHMNS